jgi:hypothetical protein
LLKEILVTIFSLVLFIHVLSAMALFIAIALEGFLLVRLRSARDRGELQFPVLFDGWEGSMLLHSPGF